MMGENLSTGMTDIEENKGDGKFEAGAVLDQSNDFLISYRDQYTALVSEVFSCLLLTAQKEYTTKHRPDSIAVPRNHT